MRTDIKWDKHELLVESNDLVTIHHLKKPNTYQDSVKFINVQGVLVVTGDYGNWMFCRDFSPADGDMVSDYYWLEKLRISSSQEGEEFSTEKTRAAINRGLKGGLKEQGFEGEELKKVKEYYKDLLEYVDCHEAEYMQQAHSNYPSFCDYEIIPFEKDTKYWLKAVFDAFDEICKRLKKTKPA